VGKDAWITLPRKGACEIIIAARRKGESGKYEYQIKGKDGVLHKKGEWVPQEKLSEI